MSIYSKVLRKYFSKYKYLLAVFLLPLCVWLGTILKKYQLYDYVWTRQNISCAACGEYKHRLTPMPFEELELYLRMGSRFLKQYNDYLLPSLRYFWPRNVSIVVILDEESAQDKELAKSLAERYPYPRIEYQSPIDPGIYHGVGHERMQRDYFYPENNTKKTYVGYLDTDSVFVTKVIPDLLFEEGKPIVIANYGKRDTDWWSQAAMTTEAIFKSKEVMKCMAYFPVIMKVSHIVELRGYLEKLHNKPFDEIYRQFSGRPIAQFNIMCQYIWAFHKDEYKFHFHLWSYNNGSWQGEDNSPGRQPYEFYLTNVTEEQKVPKPRAAIHYRYHYSVNWEKSATYIDVLKTGICFSGGFYLCPDQCKHLNQTVLHKQLYFFEYNDWSWDKRCLDEQRKHYTEVAKRRNAEADNDLKISCIEVDKLFFTT
ncbi:hypothetical protein CHS0354_011108 [Potamilus streckersoni]|uniref:Uncharacterized protein n=1 Tax=Potamilus streckersoni TaxID=2493646 RepID=A0AAE0TC90_9BIVA|nr:hypothetical protein CHS0354_011108 [Potamilus streckersoni]